MITINLLPQHLRPVKRTPLPYLAAILVLAAAVAGMGLVYLQNTAEIRAAQRDLDEKKVELDALKIVVQEYNDMVAEKKELAAKLETIQEIVNDRIIWSRQLHNLNRLAPANLWYEGIVVENRPFKERIKYEEPPGSGKIREKVVRVDRPVLKLDGYVISIDGEKPTISPLTLATEEDQEFSRRFQLQSTAFADTTFETFPVRSFTLEYSIEYPRTAAEKAELVEEALAAEAAGVVEDAEAEELEPEPAAIAPEEDAELSAPAVEPTADGATAPEETAL